MQKQNRKNSQSRRATTSRHMGSIQGCRDAPHMHSTDPNPDAPNPAAPPHLPHMHARISAHTTTDQHAAKPGVQKNARTSGQTVVPERGTRGRLRHAIDSAAPSDRRLPPLAAPRCGRTSGMSRKRPARMGLHIPAQNEHGYMVDRGSMRA